MLSIGYGFVACDCRKVIGPRRIAMGEGKLCILGDSVLKGIQWDEASSKHVTRNELDWDGIADRAGLKVENLSKFGCTVTKAWDFVQKRMVNGLVKCIPDMVIMDFGGNDSDFNWKAVSDSPLEVHDPNTDISTFVGTYEKMLDAMVAKGVRPVITTLVPVQSSRYFDWFCRNLNLDKSRVMSWLGVVERIEHFQLTYSEAILGIAAGRGIPLVDIRAAFEAEKGSDLMCADGIHPNTNGQHLIHECFEVFIGDSLTF